MRFGQVGNIHMRDGAIITPVHEARYLGCQLNDRTDGIRAVKKRSSDCMAVLNRLDLFWGHGNCSIKRKLNVQKPVSTLSAQH